MLLSKLNSSLMVLIITLTVGSLLLFVPFGLFDVTLKTLLGALILLLTYLLFLSSLTATIN
jgi:hypothetical protein